MHFGFSYVGLIYLIMLMTPNIIWTKNKPKDYEKYVVNENKVLLGIPVAGATLPVLAFALLAVYGRNIVLGIAVLILGIGHIGIHLMHMKECEKEE